MRIYRVRTEKRGHGVTGDAARWKGELDGRASDGVDEEPPLYLLYEDSGPGGQRLRRCP